MTDQSSFSLLEQTASMISRSKTPVVCGHIMPDGDCISSVLSLSLGLWKLGIQAVPTIDWPIPSEFEGFPCVHNISDFSRDVSQTDLLICVDSSTKDRLGRFETLIDKGLPSVVIDHHTTNTMFGELNWVAPEYSSTAQMILRLLKFMKVDYDEELALVNYLGIATDTGFFRYSTVDETVFSDAAELVRMGADPAFVARQVLERNRVEFLYLKRDAINNLELHQSGLVAVSYLRNDSFVKYGIREDEFSGFVNELRAIDTVEVAIFASEDDKGNAHFSLRSKTSFDVSKVAQDFGGGGHKNAAGFTHTCSEGFCNALEELLQVIRKQLQSEHS